MNKMGWLVLVILSIGFSRPALADIPPGPRPEPATKPADAPTDVGTKLTVLTRPDAGDEQATLSISRDILRQLNDAAKGEHADAAPPRGAGIRPVVAAGALSMALMLGGVAVARRQRRGVVTFAVLAMLLAGVGTSYVLADVAEPGQPYHPRRQRQEAPADTGHAFDVKVEVSDDAGVKLVVRKAVLKQLKEAE